MAVTTDTTENDGHPRLAFSVINLRSRAANSFEPVT
jgi:hypothetical protein